MRRRIGPGATADALLAGAFALAAAVEAVARFHRDTPTLALGLGGAVAMMVLLVRRKHPLLAMTAFCISGAAATTAQARLSDGAGDAFTAIVALIVLAYSLGAHGDATALALGAPQPVLLVGLVDVVDPGTQDVGSGLVFATAFVVILPVVVGRLVRSRRQLTAELRFLEAEAAHEHEQRLRMARARESVTVSQVLDETLATGLEQLLCSDDIGVVEERARGLLAATRDTVVRLSREPLPSTREDAAAAMDIATPAYAIDDASGQTWAVLLAAALGTGLLVESGLSWRGLPLIAVLVGGIVWTARRPLPAVIVVWVAATLMSRTIDPLGDTFSGIGLTMATPFLACWLGASRVATAAVAVGLGGAMVGLPMTDRVGAMTLTVLAVVGGAILRDRTALLAEVRSARDDAAEGRRDELRVAALEERAALARELHDSVGHALTVVALQAGAARRLHDSDPAAAAGARDTIERTARAALLELRRGFEVRPGSIDGLIDTARSAGLDVEVTGPPPPPDLTAVVYRVLQEALTNVMRHAPGAKVAIRLRAASGDDGYRCTVSNALTAGGPSAYPSAGHGLPGMRARVQEIGGTVEWNTEQGDFTVTATFPTHVESIA